MNKGERASISLKLAHVFLICFSLTLGAREVSKKKNVPQARGGDDSTQSIQQMVQPIAQRIEDGKKKRDLAEWSILVYMQADNNLASFAGYNINDMKAGMQSADGVNVLVQWDQPNNNKTWRYQVVPGNAVEAGSLNTEMGFDPAGELVDAMKWVQTTYPAKKYALILWNHGSGIEDFRLHQRLVKNLWLLPAGFTAKADPRGILYDDSQNTCLTNQGLLSAMQKITNNLGKKVDLLGMDACLMAMLEVGYQVRDYASCLVASEQTEPGQGWPYSGFLAPLTSNPTGFDEFKLAQAIVSAYGAFYKKTNVYDYTLSAVDLSSINDLANNVNQFAAAVARTKAVSTASNKAITKILTQARNSSLEMYMREYIDLGSFYSGCLSQVKVTDPKSSKILMSKLGKEYHKKVDLKYQKAYDDIKQIVINGLSKIDSAVFANVAGPQFSRVHGMAIYYPKKGSIDPSYPKTLFAQDVAWMQYLRS